GLAYVTIDYCDLEILDISDPANMEQVHWSNPWNCLGLSWYGSDGHTNELAMALGDSLLFISGADTEVMVHNITAPTEPVLVGGHMHPNDPASTWGLDVHGDLVVANYINNQGLPFQPYDSTYGGVVLFQWQATFTTGLSALGPASIGMRIVPNPST